MPIGITKTILAALISATALMTTTAHSPSPESTDAASCPRGAVLLDCLVYRIDDAALSREIERATAKEPEATYAVLALLEKAEQGAHRLARIHSPLEFGRDVRFSTSKQVPTITVSQGRVSQQVSFAGYQEATTSLHFTCNQVGDDFSTTYAIEIESFSETKKPVSQTPPPRDRIALNGAVSGPTGVTRMCQLSAGGDDGGMLLVFLTTTAL